MAMKLTWVLLVTAAYITTCCCVREIDCFKGENSCSGNDVHRIRLLRQVICCPKSRHFRITRDCKCVEGSLTVSNSDLISSLLGPGQATGSRGVVSRVRVLSSRMPGRSAHVTITTHHANSNPARAWFRRATSWRSLARDVFGWSEGHRGSSRPNVTDSLFPFSPFTPLVTRDPDLTLTGGGVRGVRVRPQRPEVTVPEERTPPTSHSRRRHPSFPSESAPAPPSGQAGNGNGNGNSRAVDGSGGSGGRRPIEP